MCVCFLLYVYQLELNLLLNVFLELADGQTYLLHSIAVTNGYAVVCRSVLVANGLKVDGDAKRSTDFVLAAVTLTDRTGLVIVNHKVLGKLLVDLARLITKLLGKRQNSSLKGRKSRMQVKHGTNVVLCFVDHFFVISVNKECKSHTVSTERGLDYVRNVMLARLLIEVGHILAAVGLVLTKVVVGTVSNAPKLAPSKREEELEVGGCLGVEAELVRIVVTQTEVLISHTEVEQELMAVVLPVCEPLEVGAGLAEELKLHLFELTGAENEVAGGNFVTEGLTDLRNTEGQLFARGALCCGEVYKDTLRGFGTKINGVCVIFGNTDKGLEHQVELLDVSKIMAAALRASDALLFDVGSHFLKAPSGRVVIETILECVIFNELVCSVTHFALLAVHKGVGETANVTGSHPSLGIHNNGAVKAYIIFALLNELFPPSALNVVLKLNAKRAVVPGVCQATVNFGAGEDKAASFAKRDDFVHCFFRIIHSTSPLLKISLLLYHLFRGMSIELHGFLKKLSSRSHKSTSKRTYHFTEYSFLKPCPPKICHSPTPRRCKIAFLSSAHKAGSASTDVIKMGAY